MVLKNKFIVVLFNGNGIVSGVWRIGFFFIIVGVEVKNSVCEF